MRIWPDPVHNTDRPHLSHLIHHQSLSVFLKLLNTSHTCPLLPSVTTAIYKILKWKQRNGSRCRVTIRRNPFTARVIPTSRHSAFSLLFAGHGSRLDESFCPPIPRFLSLDQHHASGLQAGCRMIFIKPEGDVATRPLQLAMTFHHLARTMSVWNAAQEPRDTPSISEAHLYPLGPTDTIPQATQVPECAGLS